MDSNLKHTLHYVYIFVLIYELQIDFLFDQLKIIEHYLISLFSSCKALQLIENQDQEVKYLN